VILEGYYGNIIHGFGEFHSIMPNDPYNSFFSGHADSNSLPDDDETLGLHYTNAVGAGTYGLEFHRSASGEFAPNGHIVSVGGAHIMGNERYFSSLESANTGLGFYLSPCYVACDTATEKGLKLVRGKLRGMYQPLAYKPMNHQDVHVDPETGKSYLCVHYDSDNESDDEGVVFFDITGPW
jgi:hypothetical protein